MVAGLASEATPQGLESELMWLPRGVATHIEVRASPAAYPCAPCSHHTPGMHRGVNVTFTAGRWGAWLASPGQGIVPLSPLPCSCSLSRQLGGLMSHQTHPPIKFMVYPSIVWCSPVTDNHDPPSGHLSHTVRPYTSHIPTLETRLEMCGCRF